MRIAMFLLFFIISFPAAADTGVLTGKARVIDGDTINISGASVRLKGIAAPEKDERGGDEAREALRELINDKEVRCELTGERTHNRVVGYCYANGVDLNGEMVRLGYARACPRFSTKYVAQETEPKQKQVGVWSYGYPLPPYCKTR